MFFLLECWETDASGLDCDRLDDRFDLQPFCGGWKADATPNMIPELIRREDFMLC